MDLPISICFHKDKKTNKKKRRKQAPCLLGRPQVHHPSSEMRSFPRGHAATLADPAHESATVLKNLLANDNDNKDDQYNEDQKQPGK